MPHHPPDFWAEDDKLTSDEIAMLEKPFTLEEVKHVVFSYNSSKAPRPDGFSFLFYQEFWDLILSDVMKLVNSFYYNQLDVARINLASICLIPKKADAISITQFRP